jgi:hypothetical protein
MLLQVLYDLLHDIRTATYAHNIKYSRYLAVVYTSISQPVCRHKVSGVPRIFVRNGIFARHS